MISIIPTILIVYIINAVKNTTEMTFRIVLINEAMLRPIAHHHNESRINHRNNKDHQCRLKVDKTHSNTKQDKRSFTDTKPGVDFLTLTAEQIHEGINDTNHNKSQKIFHEVYGTISSIFQGTACIIFLIVFNMVHYDMMGKIGLRGIAKKWSHYPGDIIVHPHILFLKHWTMANAVEHQTKPTFKIGLRHIGIWDIQQPPIHALN